MTFLTGRTAGRYAGPMLPRLLLLAVLAFAVTACGVKNDLVKPNGQTAPHDEHDPAKPPYPLGR
jgi:predicted small lipoprotein YifL